ncbi:MAG: nicotinate-nucleotide adenylyltransferase [Prevotella sp.]|nr:nicotinate-nucleotide adenylyltransferase [Prevotella sp.]
MLIGLFGGSFNPVHKGHVSLARNLLAREHLDEVWFMVSPQNPLKKQTDLADDNDRLNMVRLALENEKGLKACDYEFHLSRPSFTWNTLEALRRDYPGDEFVLLIGADNWCNIDRWARYEEIISNYRIIVYPRDGYPVDTTQLPTTVRMVDTPLYNVSSTEIRQRLAAGKSVTRLIDKSVASYITRNRLYF